MPFEEFLQTRIFVPLGMVDTGFSVPPEKVDRFAALYRPDKEGGLERVGDAPLANDEVSFFPSGGGGLVSTAADYMRFFSNAAQRRRTRRCPHIREEKRLN